MAPAFRILASVALLIVVCGVAAQCVYLIRNADHSYRYAHHHHAPGLRGSLVADAHLLPAGAPVGFAAGPSYSGGVAAAYYLYPHRVRTVPTIKSAAAMRQWLIAHHLRLLVVHRGKWSTHLRGPQLHRVLTSPLTVLLRVE